MSEAINYEIIVNSSAGTLTFERKGRKMAEYEIVVEEGTDKAFIPLEVLLMIQRLREVDMELAEVIYPRSDMS